MATNFKAFRTVTNMGRGECSSYKNIPISMLEVFRKAFPGQYRIRYRGPRNDDRYSKMNKQLDCLKSHANRFSAYLY